MAVLIQAKKIARAFIVAIMSIAMLASAFAEEPPLQLYEQKIKAGLVYNLLKYTTWPKQALTAPSDKPVAEKNELQICLFGDDPFDGYLAPLEGRTAQQSLISINHIKQINEAEICSAVIIHRSQEKHLAEILSFLEGKQVLTISDINQFARQGGMVEMAKEGEKISLYINKNSIDKAGLEIEGSMLKLAKLVSR